VQYTCICTSFIGHSKIYLSGYDLNLFLGSINEMFYVWLNLDKKTDVNLNVFLFYFYSLKNSNIFMLLNRVYNVIYVFITSDFITVIYIINVI